MANSKVEFRDLTNESCAMEDEDQLDTFIEEAARALAFLCDRYDFGQPCAEIDRRAFSATVTFSKGSVAIEAIFDLREGDVELKIVRLEDGQMPDAYHVDRQGHRCRAGLVEILLKRGVRGFGLRQPKASESLRQRLERLLGRYGELLEAHGADILLGSSEALDLLADSKPPRL